MPSSARLDKETEDILCKTAELLGVTKSHIVRESVKVYCREVWEEKKTSPWEIYQSIRKAGGSGNGKRVLNGKNIIKKKLEATRKKWSL